MNALSPSLLEGSSLSSHAYHFDAEILYLANLFIQNERKIHALPCDGLPNTRKSTRQEIELRALIANQVDLTDRLGKLHARTPDGVNALAQCLAVHNHECAFSFDDPGTTTGKLVWQLMRSALPHDRHQAEPSQTCRTWEDCELLALCDEFTALEDAYSATFHKGNPAYIRDERKREKANDPRVKRQEEIAPVIAATPAHTDAGVIAKLRSFAKWDKEILKPDYPGNMAEVILSSACRDVMRGAGA